MAGERVAIIGVPTSAGAHHAGQDRAPAALRAAGFVRRLETAGLDVQDRGDLPATPFGPDEPGSTARNLAAVVAVARRVADAVAAALADGRLPVLLGGDCTLTLGVVAGVQRRHPDVGLLYVDGDADLATPEATQSGVLDSMGVAHLLGVTDNALSRVGERWPLLRPDRLAMLGYDETDASTYRPQVLAAHPGLWHASGPQLRADPAGTARAGLRALGPGGAEAGSGVIVHFDVDLVDSRDLPLGNFPHYGLGLSLAAATEVLAEAFAAPGLRAVALTEVNPSYDPTGDALRRYVDAVAGTFATSRAPAPVR
jgi:arginase